jgi:hypothetical protein
MSSRGFFLEFYLGGWKCAAVEPQVIDPMILACDTQQLQRTTRLGNK